MSGVSSRHPMPDGQGFTGARIFWGVVLASAGLFLVLGAMWILERGIGRFERASQGAAGPLMQLPRVTQDVALEVPGKSPFKEQMAKDRAHLESYGWIDRSKGLVHIPIHRAKALWLERQR